MAKTDLDGMAEDATTSEEFPLEKSREIVKFGYPCLLKRCNFCQ